MREVAKMDAARCNGVAAQPTLLHSLEADKIQENYTTQPVLYCDSHPIVNIIKHLACLGHRLLREQQQAPK